MSNINIYLRSKSVILSLIILGIFLIFSLIPSYIAPYSPSEIVGPPFSPPSSAHLMGTDYLGEDLFSLLVWGTRRSLIVGFLAGLFAVLIGVCVGVVAGYKGGLIDNILMRFTDMFISMPSVVLAIVLASILGPSTANIILAISITSWMSVARVIRSDVLVLKTKPFVQFAKLSGGNAFYIIKTHIIPNEVYLIISNTLLTMAGAVLSEAGLSFLGVGNLSEPSWGIVLHYAQLGGAIVVGAWWNVLFPGLFIMLLVMSLMFLGKGIEKIYSSKLLGVR